MANKVEKTAELGKAPAVNAEPSKAVSIIDTLNAMRGDGSAPEPDAIVLSEAEYERRSKLPVNDSDYINPSLEHHVVAKKGK